MTWLRVELGRCCIELHYGGGFADAIASFIRDFKIQRRDSNENVALTVNLRSFSLYRDNSYLLTFSIVREPSYIWIHGTIFKFRKRNKISSFSVKHEIRHFHAVVVQKGKEMYKKREAHAKSLFG